MRRMKAYARLAVQFLVVYAMVFQQVPVAAFAQQAAEPGDNTEAAQPAEQQEAADQDTEKTQAAETPAAKDARPLDAGASDGAQAAAETEQWSEFGTCLWSIDGDGLLTIKPKDESTGGEIGTDSLYLSSSPWESRRNEIKSVKFLGKIKAANNIGYLISDIYSMVARSSNQSISATSIPRAPRTCSGCSTAAPR